MVVVTLKKRCEGSAALGDCSSWGADATGSAKNDQHNHPFLYFHEDCESTYIGLSCERLNINGLK
jgi:hypothetical protein